MISELDYFKLSNIQKRHIINQHNIDCLSNGTPSQICGFDCSGATACDYGVSKWPAMLCSRCFHRGHMNKYPEASFIGYTTNIKE